MMNTNSTQEKQQPVWSLAIALVMAIAVIAPQETSAQNSVSQDLIDLAQNNLQSAVEKVIK